uniref:Uncharacterized protein n=1 Tax=Arundo donax TaxID=35708 RepID=A0A0A9DFB1_ARUDO
MPSPYLRLPLRRQPPAPPSPQQPLRRSPHAPRPSPSSFRVSRLRPVPGSSAAPPRIIPMPSAVPDLIPRELRPEFLRRSATPPPYAVGRRLLPLLARVPACRGGDERTPSRAAGTSLHRRRRGVRAAILPQRYPKP